MRVKKIVIVSFLILIVSLAGLWLLIELNLFNVKHNEEEQPVYIMVNQVGYLENGEKIAIIRTNATLEGQKAIIRNLENETIMVLSITQDLGEGYNFKHHYLLNFSDLTSIGFYYISVNQYLSPTFEVSPFPYKNVLWASLNFFELNKCSNSTYHQSCHRDDGIIANGPYKGVYVNLTGGWHDAGDYIKFAVPTAETMLLLLFSLEQKHSLIYNKNYADTLFYGLSWINKLWLKDYNQLVYMVGNRTDHYQGLRLPENDALHDRPVYVCEPGKGANVAGAVSSVMLLAYKLHLNGILNSSFLNSDYLAVAEQIYSFGLENPGNQIIGLNDWVAYPEWGWEDDMALASTLLYLITSNQTYLERAISYHEQYHQKSDVPYTPANLLTEYYLGIQGHKNIVVVTEETMSWNFSLLKKDPLFWPWPEYYWGSLYTLLILSFAERVYHSITGSNYYHIFTKRAVDYIMGANQWGICFITGFGKQYPQNLHHQILYLKKIQVKGIMAEGGVSKDLVKEMGIEILPPEEDKYNVFQSQEAFYQDSPWNYVTNEPTIRAQAMLFLVLNMIEV